MKPLWPGGVASHMDTLPFLKTAIAFIEPRFLIGPGHDLFIRAAPGNFHRTQRAPGLRFCLQQPTGRVRPVARTQCFIGLGQSGLDELGGSFAVQEIIGRNRRATLAPSESEVQHLGTERLAPWTVER